METYFMMGLGCGWGLGIAVGIYLSKILWYSQEESVWKKHKRNQQIINEAVQKELQKVK